MGDAFSVPFIVSCHYTGHYVPRSFTKSVLHILLYVPGLVKRGLRTVCLPYPRRLESLTVYKCYYKRQHFLPLKINIQVTRISIARVTKICWQISDNTRNFSLSYITHCRNNFPKFSIRFQGPKCFNSLRREIQQWKYQFFLAKDLKNASSLSQIYSLLSYMPFLYFFFSPSFLFFTFIKK